MDGKERGEGWRERAEERREGGAQGGRIYWPMGGGRVGGRGRELDWERSTPPLELRIPMRKKKGGGEGRWTGRAQVGMEDIKEQVTGGQSLGKRENREYG